MSVLCVHVCRLCVPNIMSLGVCFLKTESCQSWGICLMQRQNSRFFHVQFERRKVDKKSKPTRKLKHTNSILEYFEHFCQMTSKSIHIISSYTVSKLRRFFWDTVYICRADNKYGTAYHTAIGVTSVSESGTDEIAKRVSLSTKLPRCQTLHLNVCVTTT